MRLSGAKGNTVEWGVHTPARDSFYLIVQNCQNVAKHNATQNKSILFSNYKQLIQI